MSLFSCEDANRLISKALDAELTLSGRLLLYGHLAICSTCRRVRVQISFLHAAVARLGVQADRDGQTHGCLSPQARERIQRALDSRNDDGFRARETD